MKRGKPERRCKRNPVNKIESNQTLYFSNPFSKQIKMKLREVLKNNERKFVDDFKMVREILVFCGRTHSFFKIRKMEVAKTAERSEIRYYITDKIFTVERNSMVIIYI